MHTQLIATITLAAFGIVWGPLIAFIAAKRVAAQPVASSPDAERRVLAAVLANPELVEVAHTNTGLVAEHFAHTGRSAVWAALAAELAAGTEEPVVAARAALDAAGDEDGVAQFDQAVALAGGDDRHGDGPLRDDDAGRVVANFEDRTNYSGSAPLAHVDGEQPLERRYQPPSGRRLVSAAFWVGAGFALSSLLTEGGGAAGVLTTLALCLVVALGYFVAVVDHDTLYLDIAGFFAGSALTWGAAVAGLLAGSLTSNIWVGVAGGLLWAIVFELANLIYKLLRGVHGQGFGDTLIVLTCVGVPTAIAGDILVAVFAVVAAGIVAMLAHVPQLFRRTHGLRTALPFGPFLAIGWAVAWPALILIGAI